jgi:hypothetical protein
MKRVLAALTLCLATATAAAASTHAASHHGLSLTGWDPASGQGTLNWDGFHNADGYRITVTRVSGGTGSLGMGQSTSWSGNLADLLQSPVSRGDTLDVNVMACRTTPGDQQQCWATNTLELTVGG